MDVKKYNPKRNRRLRKKLKTDEFQENFIDSKFTLYFNKHKDDHTIDETVDRVMDRIIDTLDDYFFNIFNIKYYSYWMVSDVNYSVEGYECALSNALLYDAHHSILNEETASSYHRDSLNAIDKGVGDNVELVIGDYELDDANFPDD